MFAGDKETAGCTHKKKIRKKQLEMFFSLVLLCRRKPGFMVRYKGL